MSTLWLEIDYYNTPAFYNWMEELNFTYSYKHDTLFDEFDNPKDFYIPFSLTPQDRVLLVLAMTVNAQLLTKLMFDQKDVQYLKEYTNVPIYVFRPPA